MTVGYRVHLGVRGRSVERATEEGECERGREGRQRERERGEGRRTGKRGRVVTVG